MHKMMSGLIAVAALAAASGPAFARNDKAAFPLAGVLGTAAGAADRIDHSIPVRFGGGRTGASALAANVVVSTTGLTAKEACDRALRGAVIQLQVQAAKTGARAINGITSTHEKLTSASSSEYLCGIGNVQVRVILHGSVAAGRAR